MTIYKKLRKNNLFFFKLQLIIIIILTQIIINSKNQKVCPLLTGKEIEKIDSAHLFCKVAKNIKFRLNLKRKLHLSKLSKIGKLKPNMTLFLFMK